jgi:hypothetical protein
VVSEANEQPPNVTSPFDTIRHFDGEREYWLAKDLAKIIRSDMGYKGLYGGLTENDIHALKQLAPDEEISNWMSSEE